MFRISVFVSGRGSNLRALLDSPLTQGTVAVAAVLSDKRECGAFEVADAYGIPHFTVTRTAEPGTVEESSLTRVLYDLGTEAVVLAGYLKLIPGDLIAAFPEKIINIHPALLPFFGGAGMYGIRVHKAVFASGMKVSGPTVHFVNEEYDQGAIIAQRAVSISHCTTPEEIAAEVLKAEHTLLPEVVAALATGRIKQEDGRYRIT